MKDNEQGSTAVQGEIVPAAVSFQWLSKREPASWRNWLKRKQFIQVSASIACAGLWLVLQAHVLALDTTITIQPGDLPKVANGKLTVLPAPVEYDLLVPTVKAEMSTADPLVHLSKMPLPGNALSPGIIPASFNAVTPLPPPLPGILSLSAPPPDNQPKFKLVGIAQGQDGAVATIRIQQAGPGLKNDLQDVREGSTLLDGYTITRITPEYVQVSNKKAGKSFRVD